VSGVPDAAGLSPIAGGLVGAPAVADAEPDAGVVGDAGALAADVLPDDAEADAEEDGRGWLLPPLLVRYATRRVMLPS
jgi:hypothetical protein